MSHLINKFELLKKLRTPFNIRVHDVPQQICANLMPKGHCPKRFFSQNTLSKILTKSRRRFSLHPKLRKHPRRKCNTKTWQRRLELALLTLVNVDVPDLVQLDLLPASAVSVLIYLITLDKDVMIQ